MEAALAELDAKAPGLAEVEKSGMPPQHPYRFGCFDESQQMVRE